MAVSKLVYAAGNNISDTLSASTSIGASTLPVNSIALWPNKAFTVIVDRGNSSAEYIAISGTSGSSLVVAGKGQQSTSDVGHNSGASVESVPTAGDWNNLIDSVSNLALATTGALDPAKVTDLATAQILTNKRITKRVYSAASASTITPEISTYDIFVFTALAHDLVINNHSTSTPADGDMMLFEILSDSTPRAITYGDKYVAKAGTALPTTTVASKNLTMLFIWRVDLTQWNLVYSGEE